MPTTNTAHLDLDRIDLRILRLVLILSNTQSLTKTAAAMKLSVSQASRLLADARAIFGTCKSSKDHSKPRNEVDTSLKSPV